MAGRAALFVFSAFLATAAFAVKQPATVNCSALAEAGAFEPVVIRSSSGLEARFIPFGATLTHLFVPGRDNASIDVALGFDAPRQYCANKIHPYFGATIGRVANRIANGSFSLEGKNVRTTKNDGNNTLHGGLVGFDRRQWNVSAQTASSVSFVMLSPDGDQGFPGALRVRVTHTLTSDNAWVITYSANTSKTTVVALTNHVYLNLNANINGTDTVLDHVLSMPTATRFLTVNDALIPIKLEAVASAPAMDFTAPRPIGAVIADATATPTGGYDFAWVFDRWSANATVESVRATVFSPLTGVGCVFATDQPSVQIYTGNFLNGSIPRKATQGGPAAHYERWGALTLEAQHYPDAVHHPRWPSIVLNKGQTYNQTTTYAFFTAEA